MDGPSDPPRTFGPIAGAIATAPPDGLPGHRALLFAGSSADAEVIDTIRRRGGEVVAIGPESEGAALVDRLALELWRRASATAAVDQPR